MKKYLPWVLMAGGIIYLVAMIPPTIRPSWSAAPFRKADQTITVPSLTAQGTLPSDYKARLKHACRAPWALSPLMGTAKKVRVVVTWDGHPIRVTEYDCELYAS